jgi:hypothetical protein
MRTWCPIEEAFPTWLQSRSQAACSLSRASSAGVGRKRVSSPRSRAHRRGCSCLPLFLVARTWRQAAVLAIASDLVQAYVNLYANVIHPNPTVALQNTQMGRAYTLLMYIPATIMVLRRQNEGAMPAWLEQRISAWPNWLRGRSSAESTA